MPLLLGQCTKRGARLTQNGRGSHPPGPGQLHRVADQAISRVGVYRRRHLRDQAFATARPGRPEVDRQSFQQQCVDIDARAGSTQASVCMHQRTRPLAGHDGARKRRIAAADDHDSAWRVQVAERLERDDHLRNPACRRGLDHGNVDDRRLHTDLPVELVVLCEHGAITDANQRQGR